MDAILLEQWVVLEVLGVFLDLVVVVEVLGLGLGWVVEEEGGDIDTANGDDDKIK